MIEAGFPAASPGDFEAVRRIAEETRGVAVAALARCKDGDPQRAVEAIRGAERPHLHVFIATSDIHLKHKLRIDRDEALRQAVRWVTYGRQELGADAEIEFSAEDASRTDVEYLLDIYEAVVAAGASTVNIPDTVGYAIPAEFGRLVERVVARVGRDATVSVHCHNDLGLATANTLAAVQAGARQVEVTINGLGERAGNASLEEVVMALRTRPTQFPELGSRVQTEQITAASRLVSYLTGFTVQPNKAIVGGNAFAHESGIHQDGVIKNPLTYEIMTPQSVGLSRQPADDRQAVRPEGPPGQAPRARLRARGGCPRHGLPPGDRPGRPQEGSHRRRPAGDRRAPGGRRPGLDPARRLERHELPRRQGHGDRLGLGRRRDPRDRGDRQRPGQRPLLGGRRGAPAGPRLASRSSPSTRSRRSRPARMPRARSSCAAGARRTRARGRSS